MLQWKARLLVMLAALGAIASVLGGAGWDWLHWGW